jgi:Raf kinase inhibitor-like YbhB/YbcL family protein
MSDVRTGRRPSHEESTMGRPLFIADLTVLSPELDAEGDCPDRFTAWHENATPTIVVAGLPEGTVEVALVCHDPDAPRARGFTHWAVYGIPPEDPVTIGPETLGRFRVGPNGRGQAEWMGPRPPAGHGVHRYYFWAYALSRAVDGAPSREVFLDRHGDDIIEQNRLVVHYERAPEARSGP